MLEFVAEFKSSAMIRLTCTPVLPAPIPDAMIEGSFRILVRGFIIISPSAHTGPRQSPYTSLNTDDSMWFLISRIRILEFV